MNIIYSPNDIATLGHEYLQYRRENKSSVLPFFVPKMKRVYPFFPGELASIIARPGHGKSAVMMYWARHRATWLRENAPTRLVIYSTWEQSIEELNSFYVAAEQKISITDMAMGNLTDEEWKKTLTAAGQRISEPLWFIGHSVMRRSGRTPIDTETLYRALEQVKSWGDGFEVDSLFVDYLQRIPPRTQVDSPVVAYSRILDELKTMALGFGIPVIVGVQAVREVDNLPLPIPEIQHGQWTSNIEQSSDRVFSLVRPRRYRNEGGIFGSKTVTGHNQMLVSVLKQKLGEANFADWVNFAPQYNQLDEKELDYGGVQ